MAITSHPLPEADSWPEHTAMACDLLKRPEQLNAFQQQVFKLWQRYKLLLKQNLEHKLNGLLAVRSD